MEIFKNLEPNGEFEKNTELINQMKSNLEEKLTQMNFTPIEKKGVMNIIEGTMIRINSIKEGLIGTNINQNPEKATKKANEEITKLTQEMVKKIQQKVMMTLAVKKGNQKY